QEEPVGKAGPAAPVQDWELPGLPEDCAPGRLPALLTDAQSRARIRYGHERGWAQRRVAVFADRSPSTVHKHMKALAAE
ncbi:helix-turn-helix domain-containing protein, partial [Streptomyces sp. NPDC001750]|uniref:helix-turn-helix domain-containing protein n=1 Tax=Streptomyces sp. NPDC001750 TaxID=3364607 RepID=UPI0036AEE0E2